MIAAIVPACGRSRRMGRPKLILPVAGRPVVARVVEALREGGAGRVLVVAAPSEVEGADELARLAALAGAEVIRPPAPTDDMRATVEFGVAHLERGEPPSCILLAPADSVGLTAAVVRAVVSEASARPDRLVVAAFGGSRGHPLALPREDALRIAGLPEGVGINALVASAGGRVLEVACDDPGVLADLDTPEDYRGWSP